jgi:hypothetical protein
MTNPYLKTLRRIPKPIRLAMATREYAMGDPNACLTGWALRESLAFANGKTADEYEVYQYDNFGDPEDSRRRFGGTVEEWEEIFWGVTDERRAEIEVAFFTAVSEACR